MTYPDALGTPHPRAEGVVRIVSLVPSLTELLWDLGLADGIVGRTAWCIHPRAARRVPKVGGTKDVDLERVRALAPTHVVVNIDENRREVFDALSEFVPRVVVTHPLAPRDNLDLYRLFGGIFGREIDAERLCAEFEAGWNRLVAEPRSELGVLLLIWRDPWMTVSRDTYVSRMLAAIGWRTLPARSDARYPVVDTGADWLGAVERVLLASEPFPFRERHLADAVGLVPGRPVQLVDGEMISWYGSRAIRGLDYLRVLGSAVEAEARLTVPSGAGRI